MVRWWLKNRGADYVFSKISASKVGTVPSCCCCCCRFFCCCSTCACASGCGNCDVHLLQSLKPFEPFHSYELRKGFARRMSYQPSSLTNRLRVFPSRWSRKDSSRANSKNSNCSRRKNSKSGRSQEPSFPPFCFLGWSNGWGGVASLLGGAGGCFRCWLTRSNSSKSRGKGSDQINR